MTPGCPSLVDYFMVPKCGLVMNKNVFFTDLSIEYKNPMIPPFIKQFKQLINFKNTTFVI